MSLYRHPHTKVIYRVWKHKGKWAVARIRAKRFEFVDYFDRKRDAVKSLPKGYTVVKEKDDGS